MGFQHLIDACRAKPPAHFVFASSSSVYGNSDMAWFSETGPADTPVSLYAATKKSNEMVAHTYAHLHGLPATGLRFFTVYGPAGRPGMAYLASPKPSSKARRSKCLTKASSNETSPISMTL